MLVGQAHTSWTRKHAHHVQRVEQHWRSGATATWHVLPTSGTRVHLAVTLSFAPSQAIQVQVLPSLFCLIPFHNSIVPNIILTAIMDLFLKNYKMFNVDFKVHDIINVVMFQLLIYDVQNDILCTVHSFCDTGNRANSGRSLESMITTTVFFLSYCQNDLANVTKKCSKCRE